MSVPVGVMDVTILLDDMVVDVEDSRLEELLVEVTSVDGVLETDEDVTMLVEDVEPIFDEMEDDDEDDGAVP